MIAFLVRLDLESRKTIGRQFLTRACVEALQSRKLGNDAVAHHPLSRGNANPEAVHPPERTDVITLSRSRCGGTMKPSARPGATFLERLSMTMQDSGASAASGGSLSRKP